MSNPPSDKPPKPPPMGIRYVGPNIRVTVDADTHRRCRAKMFRVGVRSWDGLVNRMLAAWCDEPDATKKEGDDDGNL
jgi:hypothetical protein